MKKSKKVEKINKNNQKRLLIFEIIIFVLFFLLLIRICYWQFIKGDFLSTQANTQQTTTKTILANRGTIFDSKGQTLAISAEVDTVSVNSSKILYSDKTEVPKEILAQKFSELFDIDYAETLEKLNKNTSYVTIATKVENDTIEELEAWLDELKISTGVNIDSTINRYYPYSTLASNLIGFTGTDTHGLIGLECSLDSILAGTDGKMVTLTDSINGEIPAQQQTYIEAEDGNDVYLTIDVNIQSTVEKYLSQAVEDNEADGGTAIIMQPSTGNILAMATYPDYDLNTPFTPTNSKLLKKWKKLSSDEKNTALYQMWNNSAVQSTYEPGSTFKIITAATAIEEGIVDPEKKGVFYCNGSQKINDNLKIRCWNYANPHGYQSLKDALANSCNPAFIQLGQKIGAETLYKYYEAFGLFETTNSSVFYGESNSVFFDEVDESNLATMSFGQRFTITPIQLITAVSAIANEGVLVEPQIIEKVVDSSTGAVLETEVQEIRQVISSETAETLMEMLEYVVTDGTGKYAKVSGYSVGGKSGTSEPLDSDKESGYVASFIGLSPTTNTEVVVLVAIYNPTAGLYQGGQVAGPVVSQILSEVLPSLEVASDSVSTSSSDNYTTKTLPDVRNMTVSKAKETLKSAGFNVTISKDSSSSNLVVDQTPKPGTTLLKGAEIYLYTKNSNVKTSTSVPNFKGMSASQAINSAKSKGLNISLNGSGIVIMQDVASGTKVEHGTVISLTLQKELDGGY